MKFFSNFFRRYGDASRRYLCGTTTATGGVGSGAPEASERDQCARTNGDSQRWRSHRTRDRLQFGRHPARGRDRGASSKFCVSSPGPYVVDARVDASTHRCRCKQERTQVTLLQWVIGCRDIDTAAMDFPADYRGLR